MSDTILYDLWENYHGSHALTLSQVTYTEAHAYYTSRPGDFYLMRDGVFVSWSDAAEAWK